MKPTRYKVCGIFTRDAGAEVLGDARRMLVAMGADDEDARAASVAVAGGALAGGAADAPALAAAPDGSRLLLAGRLYDAEELAGRLGVDTSQITGPPDAAAALALLAARGPEAVGDLNGPFALIWFDAVGGRVIAANDRFGLWPLYWLDAGDRLLVASECKAVLALEQLPPDPAGWACFFAVNHMLADRTAWQGLTALGPGQYLEWDGRAARVHQYWRMSDLPLMPPGEADAADMIQLLDRAVERRARLGGDQLLLCSGGFDSRIILGRLVAGGWRVPIMFRGHNTRSGRAELEIVRRLAKIAGVECDARVEQSPRPWMHEEIESHHVLDGLRPQAGLFGGHLLPRLAELRPDGVWDGLAMGLLLGGQHQHSGSLRRSFRHYARDWWVNRRLLAKVLSSDWMRQLATGLAETVERTLEEQGGDEEGWRRHLFLHRTRRRVAPNPTVMWSRCTLPLIPGADREALEYELRLPWAATRDKLFYIEIFRQANPELLEVPVVSAGHAHDTRDRNGDWRTRLVDHARRREFWGRRLGFWPIAQAWSRRRRGIGPSHYGPVLRLLREVKLDGSLYNRPYIEKALRRLEAGRLFYLAPLLLVFQMQLWQHLFNPDGLAMVRGVYAQR